MTFSSKTGRFVADGYSAIGLSHLKSSRPNQDSFLIRLKSYIQVFAVADGVGSHAYSRDGSKAVVRAVFKTFTEFSRGKCDEAALQERIHEHYVAGLKKKRRNAAGTTCLFAVFTKKKLYLGQAGDGVCCVFFNDIFKATGRKNTDFMNEVHAIDANRPYSGWRMRAIDLDTLDRADILLMTDGIADDILPDKMKDFTAFVIDKMANGGRGEIKKLIVGWDVPCSSDDKTMVAVRWKHDING